MAANVDTMFSVREVPWHGLGRIIEDAPTSADAIVAAGLDWEVGTEKLFTESGIDSGAIANVRMDTQTVLGIVTDRYKLVQNVDAFDFMDSLSSDEKLTYETAGALGKGERVWMLAKVDQFKILDDQFDGYICLTNSHDGKGAVKVAMTPIRVVCQNTLNLALNSAKRTWTTKHMGNMKYKREQAAQTLGLYEHYMTLLGREAEDLASIKLSNSEVEKIVTNLFPYNEDETDRKINNMELMRSTVMSLYNDTPNIQNFKGTGWGLINAVTDFVDHSEPLRSTETFEERRFASIIDGHKIVDFAHRMVRDVA